MTLARSIPWLVSPIPVKSSTPMLWIEFPNTTLLFGVISIKYGIDLKELISIPEPLTPAMVLPSSAPLPPIRLFEPSATATPNPFVIALLTSPFQLVPIKLFCTVLPLLEKLIKAVFPPDITFVFASDGPPILLLLFGELPAVEMPRE